MQEKTENTKPSIHDNYREGGLSDWQHTTKSLSHGPVNADGLSADILYITQTVERIHGSQPVCHFLRFSERYEVGAVTPFH